MGAPRDYSREGKGDWASPREPAEAGCPGSWYRTDWLASLRRYMRREGSGGRIDNPVLSRCDDPLVHEAIAELEAQEDAATAEHLERIRKG